MRDIKSLRLLIDSQLVQPLAKISVIDLVDLIIEYGYAAKASDIHLDPGKLGARIRFRVDGLLMDVFGKLKLNNELHHEIIARIKVLAGLRTDEHFIPQDGRLRVKVEGFGDVDVRVSIAPTYYGENSVLRVLAETQGFDLESLGFAPDELKKIEHAIKRPYGMILANGPTGSGKSTTLYTILKRLNLPEVSIITVEDPIEYSLEGATQIQIHEQAGLTFASGLRSILRQDPNIIMVGEIRDQDTASISVNAALTGHLVLSTLHTNDAATTFPRLLDMGVPPFLVASTVNVAIGQRLIRKVCERCRVERSLRPEELRSLQEILPEAEESSKYFFVGEGCSECNKIGYKGRIGVREVLEVGDEIRQLIMSRANANEIKEAAVRGGMVTMVKDGVQKAVQGITSLEEVLRLIHE